MYLQVSLEKFEGPLALLLFLIRKEEMNIYDIPIHRITQQYLDHIKLMRELDLDVASEFITMAATLIHIKSKMLLPQHETEDGEIPEDPRKELVLRLLEYQKYQDAAQKLNQRPLLGREIFSRGTREDLSFAGEGESDIEIDEKGLFNLISMYRFMIRSMERRIHRVMVKAQSVASRILELKESLIPGQRTLMSALIRPVEMARTKVVVTFLSILELAKMGFVSLYQTEPYAPIYIETLRIVDRDVVQRIDDYDQTNAIRVQSTLGLNTVPLTDEDLNESESVAAASGVDTNELPIVVNDEEANLGEAATDEEIVLAEKELDLQVVEIDSSPSIATTNFSAMSLSPTCGRRTHGFPERSEGSVGVKPDTVASVSELSKNAMDAFNLFNEEESDELDPSS